MLARIRKLLVVAAVLLAFGPAGIILALHYLGTDMSSYVIAVPVGGFAAAGCLFALIGVNIAEIVKAKKTAKAIQATT